MSEKFILGSADYAIFGIMLAISAAIGLYFGGQQKTNEEYLLAGKSMPVFPVTLSLMATFMSAITLMGIPTEMYQYGTHMAFMNIGYLLGPIISCFLFLPIYFTTEVSTAYEYLERRFGRTTRRILSGLFLFQNVLFIGVVLYAPALALSAVTNLSIWVSVISMGVVCTFYCTFGGMKAVVWADVFQAFLMYICLLIIIIKGCMDLGGIDNIFKTAYDGGRILLPTFDMDFSTRYTMWSIFLQGIINTTFVYGGNQIQVQRMLSVRNLRSSRIACLLSAPLLVAFQLLCCMCGLIFYVHFKACDPITSSTHPIHSADQLMPLYITSTMREWPGLPGLCIAGIFSASLSSISSGINSLAAVTYEDIIKPLWPNLKHSVLITKFASVFYGCLSILIAFFAASMGNLVKASLVVGGMVYGPGLGLYLLAVLTTTANEMGANIGVLAGFILAVCLTVIPNSRYYPQLPVEKNCSYSVTDILNVSTTCKLNLDPSASMNSSDLSPTNAFSKIQQFRVDNFPVSYMWITPLGLVFTVVVGYFASWIISCFRETETASPTVLSPVRRRFLKKSTAEKVAKIQTRDGDTRC